MNSLRDQGNVKALMRARVDSHRGEEGNRVNIPHNPDAEAAVLGAMLLDRTARERALGMLTAASFYDPKAQAIFDGIAQMHGRGLPVNPLALSAHLASTGTTVARAELDYLESQGSSVSASGHVTIVADLAARRRLLTIASGISESAQDPTIETAETVAWLERASETVRLPVDVFEPPTEANDLIDEPTDYDWLVPGLYERRDRVIWTAGEGQGKSEMQLQQAVTLASGIHPFTFGPTPRLRVLLVDLENSRRQVQRRLTRFLRIAGDRYRGGLGVVSRVEGIDLRDPRDFRWLDRLCEHHKAQALVIGPLYKTYRAHRGETKSDETPAEETADAFNRLRKRHDLMVSLEAHSPHGHQGDREGLRPYGASLWMRWPEFGFGIKRDPTDQMHAKLVDWRGARDRERDFPFELWEGPAGGWPWIGPADGLRAA